MEAEHQDQDHVLEPNLNPQHRVAPRAIARQAGFPNPLMQVLVHTPINQRRSQKAIVFDGFLAALLAGGSLWLYLAVIDDDTAWHRYVLFDVGCANFIVTGKSAFEFFSYLRFRKPPAAINHLFVPESKWRLPLMSLGAVAASIPTAATAFNTGSGDKAMEAFKAGVTLVSNAPINTTSTMIIALKPWLQTIVTIFFLPIWITPYILYKGYSWCKTTPAQAQKNKINKQLEKQYDILRKAVVDSLGNIEQKALAMSDDKASEIAEMAGRTGLLANEKKALWGQLYPVNERKAVLAEAKEEGGRRHRCAQGLRASNKYIAGSLGLLLGGVLSSPDSYYTVQTAMEWFQSFPDFWYLLAVYTMVGIVLPILFILTIDFCMETLSKLLDTLAEIIDTESGLSFVSKFYRCRNYTIYGPMLITGAFSSGAAYYIARGIQDDIEDWGYDHVGGSWGGLSEFLLWTFVSAASCFNIRSLLTTKDDGLFNWAFWFGNLPAKGCAIAMDYLANLRTNYGRMIGSTLYDGLDEMSVQGRRLFLGKMTESEFQTVKGEVQRLRGEVVAQQVADENLDDDEQQMVGDLDVAAEGDEEKHDGEGVDPGLMQIGRDHSINAGREREGQQRGLHAPLLQQPEGRGGARAGSFLGDLAASASHLASSFSAFFGKSASQAHPPAAIPLNRSNLGQRNGAAADRPGPRQPLLQQQQPANAGGGGRYQALR